jgi:hypothetical protein
MDARPAKSHKSLGGKTIQSISRGNSSSTPSSSSGQPGTKGALAGTGTGGNDSAKTGATNQAARAGASEDMGRWTSADDVALVTAVLQVFFENVMFYCFLFQSNDLRKVHAGIKFSTPFTIEEISYRWYALLYDPTISKLVKFENSSFFLSTN